MTRHALWSVLLAALLLYAGACEPAAQAKTRNLLGCGTVPVLMKRYDDLHIGHKRRDAARVAKAAEVFLDRFDGSKILLSVADARALQDKAAALLGAVDRGDCSGLEGIMAARKAAHREMLKFVQETLAAEGFAVDYDLKVALDPEDRVRPASAAEQRALRTGILHLQVANLVKAGKTLDEAKAKVIKRYELIAKRVAEQDQADVYTLLLDAYAASLDPHTSYFSVDDLEDFRIGMQLSLEGIGAVLRQRDGITTIAEIVKGGAADRQGVLKPNDKILAVSQGPDGEPVDVVDMPLREVVRHIRGNKGTVVKLAVLREGDKVETFDVLIERDKINLEEQAAKLRWEQVERAGRTLNLAVLELPSFYGSSRPGGRSALADVKKLLEQVADKRADGLVFDLGFDSGGLLQYAVDIAGLFLREGAIVRVEGTSGHKQTLEDVDERVQYSGPLVVLTSRLSASASEIFAGAIKDYRRGVLVGDDHTFGKGTVQNVVDLPEGLGALKVTTALFFRPSGVSTQKIGVDTDIRVPTVFANQHVGEVSRPDALDAYKTTPFHGRRVNGDGPQRWEPVTDQLIADLAKRSAARVKASEDFKEVEQAIAKAKTAQSFMTIREVVDGDGDGDGEGESKQGASSKGDKGDKGDKDKEAELTPQVAEALQILADMIEAQGAVAKGSPAAD